MPPYTCKELYILTDEKQTYNAESILISFLEAGKTITPFVLSVDTAVKTSILLCYPKLIPDKTEGTALVVQTCDIAHHTCMCVAPQS